MLESAARLQELVPDAVLVGGSAAALYAGHRDSLDHDHAVADLRDRFEQVLEAIESEGEWVTNRIVAGKLILGRLGKIEAGVRRLIRARPLETAELTLPSGRRLVAPTAAETLRIKAFLVIRRNQTRDYLDVAALSSQVGLDQAARTLAGIDGYYSATDAQGASRDPSEQTVASQLVRQLADPRPADPAVTRELHAYRNVQPPWDQWREVRCRCRELAAAIAATDP